MMKEVKVRGRAIALHLILGGAALVREEKDEAGHKIYVFVLEDWRIEELKEYVKEQQDRNYF